MIIEQPWWQNCCLFILFSLKILEVYGWIQLHLIGLSKYLNKEAFFKRSTSASMFGKVARNVNMKFMLKKTWLNCHKIKETNDKIIKERYNMSKFSSIKENREKTDKQN